MFDVILGLVIGGGLVALLIVSSVRFGRKSAEAEAIADKAAGRAAAAEDRLEMHREATDAEKRLGALTDAELDAELAKWSRPQR